MEIVNIEQLMRDKLTECDEWLNGKEEAVARLEEAEKAYEAARIDYERKQADVADYNDENVARVAEYKRDLEKRLGIEPEPVYPIPVEEEVEAPCADEPVVIEEAPVEGIAG